MANRRSTIDYVFAVSAVLKYLRLRGGMSQDELAAKTGLTQGAISSVETGRRVYSLNTLAHIAEVLDVRLSAIIEEAESLAKKSAEQKSAAILRKYGRL